MRQQQNIERLFRSHYEAMYNLARYLLADDDEGKDVVSDVFTQLLESSAVLIPGTERAYLMQSVRHHCFNRIAHMLVCLPTAPISYSMPIPTTGSTD